MKKSEFAVVAGLVLLGLVYLGVEHQINNRCYIATRSIAWRIGKGALVDFPPFYGQTSFVQRNPKASIDAYGFPADPVITRVLNEEILGRFVLLKADSTYFEVICMSELGGGESYMATPDAILRLVYRPVNIER